MPRNIHNKYPAPTIRELPKLGKRWPMISSMTQVTHSILYAEACQSGQSPGPCPFLSSMLLEACPEGEAQGLPELVKTYG